MRAFLFAMCVLAISVVSAQVIEVADANITSIEQIKTEPVNVGYSFKFHSEILNEDRTIMVSLPAEYNTSTKNYPVLYITDGQWNFVLSSQAIGSLGGNGIIPQMILVAVETQNYRDRDLVVTRDEQSKMGGGADNFLSFMKKELVPFIEKSYRTANYRVLAGTSFGGIFVMHAFLSEPEFFNAYISMSPSMWWDNGVLLKRTEEFLPKNADMRSYLYITVANEGLGMGVNALANILKEKAPARLKWKFDEYPEEIHETIPYKSTFNGLKFIYSEWRSTPLTFSTKGDLLNEGDEVIVGIGGTNSTIRYTMDGSEPTENSEIYTRLLTITEPVTIKAIPYFGNGIPGNCDSLVIDFVPQLKAETNLPELTGGLHYSYYEGTWDFLPDFKSLTAITTGISTDFKMNERKGDENFALRYEGFIDIPKDNVYTFYLGSDDGSRLLIGDKLIVDNDGLHGVIEKSGKVFLEQGGHRIEILFFQKGGGFEVNLQYESSEIAKQKVPETNFYINK
ncbi:MAG: alpha/beta hydrolase-fold protein [bacterium]